MPLTCLDVPPVNVVLLVLDDGRVGQVEEMPAALDRLAARGMTFSRAYTPTPLCAPSRASFLAGGWSAGVTGVLTNELPDGGVARFDDRDTLATRLQAGGYTTGLVGKYLNGYGAEPDRTTRSSAAFERATLLASGDGVGRDGAPERPGADDDGASDAEKSRAETGARARSGDPPYVPPGWSSWHAWSGGGDDWYDNVVVTGASTPTGPGAGVVERPEGYATDLVGEAAVAFIRAQGDTPFFLDVGFHAPHDPHTPAPADVDALPGYTYTGGAYQEADVSDKPAWVQAQRLLRPEEEEEAWATDRERLQTLLAVDRAVDAILDALDEAGLADSTLVILTSDNGQLWGEHRLFEKGQPYEESARVPLVVYHPALPGGAYAGLVAAPLDLAATVAAVAGLPAWGEGVDLGPALCGDPSPLHEHLLLQSWSTGTPDWAAVRTAEASFVEWATGERELYLPAADPYEERSAHEDPARADTIATLAALVAEERALAVAPADLPSATTGTAYETTLTAWGGVAPLTWALHAGSLPPGLRLAPDGTVAGVPSAPGAYSFDVTVIDTSISPATGRPQEVTSTVHLVVDGEPTCGCGGGAPTGAAWLAAVALTRRRRPRG